MRHNRKFNHLGRKSNHRKAMLANMATSLIMHKKIKTTVAKAKALRTYIEPLITRSKEDSTHSRRIVFSYLQDKNAVSELFREISPKIMERSGGYTRILKMGNRAGDNAEMCIIELVDYNENLLAAKAEATAKTGRRRRRGAGKKKEEISEQQQAEKVSTQEPEVKTEAQEQEEKTESQEPEVKTEAQEQEEKAESQEPELKTEAPESAEEEEARKPEKEAEVKTTEEKTDSQTSEEKIESGEPDDKTDDVKTQKAEPEPAKEESSEEVVDTAEDETREDEPGSEDEKENDNAKKEKKE